MNNYLYRGEQWDADLGLYYLRACYYNPLTGRFLSVDPEAGEGQRRYQYAAADPVNGLDPSGNEDMIEYGLLVQYPTRIPYTFTIPTWCGQPVIGGSIPACGGPGHRGGSGGGGGKGPGGPPPPPGGPPGTPPPPPDKTVKVCWRSLLKGKLDGSHPSPILGHWHHTYIEIDAPDEGESDTWGVLGGVGNQEVRYNDSRNSPFGSSGCEDVPCSETQADNLENALNASRYDMGSICPSCDNAYKNWWWRQTPDGFNSNTYSYNMINNFVGTPPDVPTAPGYHISSQYWGYPY
jgi:RHS repeat-associated protein